MRSSRTSLAGGFSIGKLTGFLRPSHWLADVDASHRRAPSPDMAAIFWSERFHQLPDTLDLPADRQWPTMESAMSAEASLRIALPTDIAAGDRDTFALAAYAALIHRYTTQEDIVIAVATKGGTVFVRAALISELSGCDLAADMAAQMNDCAARELSDDPSVLSTLMHHGIDAPEMLYRVGFAFGAAQRFAYRPEIALIVTGDANAVEAKLVYDRSRYETATIERMLGHYAMLLTGIVKDPAQTLTRLPILTDCERKQVLCDWNETRSDYASPAAIHLLIEQRAAASPGAIAIVHQDARLTYGELDNRASRLAHHLRGVGVGPDRVVGVYLERSIEAVVALLAVLKAGGAYLPLDASSPKDRVAFILGDADVGVVLTSSAYADGLPDWTGKTILLDRFWSDRSDSQTLSPTHCNKSSDLALLIYTSGSTGTPKGVEITHASLINNVFFWDETHGLSEASGLLQTASFSFAVFQSDVFRALSFGKKLVICHREALLSPRSLFALARREQADFVELVPTLLRNLAAYARENGETLDLFRVLVVSADRWYVREHEAVRQLCGPQTRFSHVYGMSETTFDGTYLVATSAPLESGSLMPIGKPFPNVHAYILDANDMPVPVGVGGELCIGGVGLARGYHKRPDLSAERFVANPFVPGDRLCRTGDLARFLPDGNIQLIGRRDQQVKIRGFRVEPGEIEGVLEQHPAIVAAVVQPYESSPGTMHLAACYVLRRGMAASGTELRIFAGAKLPDYMVPAAFIAMDVLPLTPSGKIDRTVLLGLVKAATAEPQAPVRATGDTIATVFDICRHALGTGKVVIDGKLDDAGMDSTGLISIIAGIETTFDITLDDDDITPENFDTVRSIIALVEAKRLASPVS